VSGAAQRVSACHPHQGQHQGAQEEAARYIDKAYKRPERADR